MYQSNIHDWKNNVDKNNQKNITQQDKYGHHHIDKELLDFMLPNIICSPSIK